MTKAIRIVVVLITGSGCTRPNDDARRGALTAITIDSIADVTIPSSSADGSWSLQNFRNVQWLRDGEFAAAGPTELHVFDSLGTHRRTVGRSGQGPGEFKYIWKFEDCGDGRFLVRDLQHPVQTLVGSPPILPQTAPLPTGMMRSLTPVLCAPPRLFYTRSSFAETRNGGGQQLETVALVRTDSALSAMDTVATATGRLDIGQADQPFGPDALAAASATWVTLARTDDSTLVLHAVQGPAIQQVTLKGLPRRPVTDSMRSAFLAEVEAANPPGLWVLLKATYEKAVWPTMLPLWSALWFDDQDRIWVREYAATGGQPERWRAFTMAGDPLGILELPLRSRLLGIRGKNVAIVTRDTEDAESIEVRSLRGLR